MHIDVVALINFLPQFVIAGAVSIYFYSTMRKHRQGRNRKVEFILDRTIFSAHEETEPGRSDLKQSDKKTALDILVEKYGSDSGVEGSPVNSVNTMPESITFSPYVPDETGSRLLSESQLIFLSLDMWILISLLLSPVNRLSSLLPSISPPYSFLIYTVLGGVLAVAILTTVTSRLNVSKHALIAMIAVAGGVTFGIFYTPSMVWVNGLHPLIRLVILYSAVVIVCMMVYSVATFMKVRKASSASTMTSFASYAITATILFFNLFTLTA